MCNVNKIDSGRKSNYSVLSINLSARRWRCFLHYRCVERRSGNISVCQAALVEYLMNPVLDILQE